MSYDPNLVIRTAEELQKRIGTLPKVRSCVLHLESQPGILVHMIRVQPKTYSEIARTVRAARTMKLTVRACGEQTGACDAIYGSDLTVLIDCTHLTDKPRIKFVNIVRKGETTETQGLRVLSCVKIEELVAFQVSHGIEIAQSVETATKWGTVVGSITASSPGVVGPTGGANGACLADEVISLRIVDCHGDLIEYSSDEEISAAVSTLGLLGIVYDVTLRYSPITMTEVKYRFFKWSELLDVENNILKYAIDNDQLIELIYLPFNSVVIDSYDEANLCGWDPEEDEVLLRTAKRLSYLSDYGISMNSEPRQINNLMDEVFGPDTHEFVRDSHKTPKLLKEAHSNLKHRFQSHDSFVQFTPWALNALGKFKDPTRILRFTMETDAELTMFIFAAYSTLHLLKELSISGPEKLSNLSFNLGLRVHFTGPTKYGRLLGIGLETADKNANRRLVLAHFCFMGITSPGSNMPWIKAANRITNLFLNRIPVCVVQWKSEWHNREAVIQKFRKVLEDKVDPLKKLIAIADRDGMFMNDVLESILFNKRTYYQKLYRSERELMLSALGDKKDEGEGGLGGRKEIDPEVEAALREAEERREAKHRKMEEEREVMRQGIRDKYGIKKKEEEAVNEFDFSSPEGRLGRKRKTAAELAAEADAADDDNPITNMLPENMRNMANKVTEVPGKLISEASEKCTAM